MNARAAERIREGSTDTLDYSALGYTIHNIYGLIENACLRIAKFFENGFRPMPGIKSSSIGCCSRYRESVPLFLRARNSS
jgi:hypothetical protein